VLITPARLVWWRPVAGEQIECWFNLTEHPAALARGRRIDRTAWYVIRMPGGVGGEEP
jgi:hypothetical protein